MNFKKGDKVGIFDKVTKEIRSFWKKGVVTEDYEFRDMGFSLYGPMYLKVKIDDFDYSSFQSQFHAFEPDAIFKIEEANDILKDML